MIFWIILVASAVIGAVGGYLGEGEPRFKRVASLWCACSGLLFFGFIGAFVCAGMQQSAGHRNDFTKQTFSTGLHAIQMTTQQHSSFSDGFFLVAGAIHGESHDTPVYYYYYADQGGYRFGHVNADKAVIVETTDAPRIEAYVHCTTYDGTWMNIGGDNCSDIPYLYKIYVPPGSVTDDISIGFPK